MAAPLLLGIFACLSAASSSGCDAGDDTGMVAAVDPPTELSVETKDRKALLKWVDNSLDEANFNVARRIESDLFDDKIYATVPADETSYVDEEVEDGETYVYRVQAARSDGEVSTWSREVKFSYP